jgi:hypothetical protein
MSHRSRRFERAIASSSTVAEVLEVQRYYQRALVAQQLAWLDVRRLDALVSQRVEHLRQGQGVR